MQYVDIDAWERKEVFKHFSSFEDPFVSVTSNIDMTNLYNKHKQLGFSTYIALGYITSVVCNRIKEFRYRIHGSKVVLYDVINPSFAVIDDKNNLSFANDCPFCDSFKDFLFKTTESMEYYKNNINFKDSPYHDDTVNVTSVPWFSFTALKHPYSGDNTYCVPAIGFGKFIKSDNKVIVPLNICVHHGFADGYHIGKFYEMFEDLCNNTDNWLNL